MLAHMLQHIAIAYRRARHAQSDAAQIALQPQIRHHGGHDAGLAQAAVLAPALRDDAHQLVAVDDLSKLVNQQQAVGVAVQRNANVGAHFAHLGDERFRRGRADVVIDVEPVRFNADGDHFRAQFPKRLRGHAIARAIGAIDDDAKAFQRQGARQSELGEFDVTRTHVVHAPRPSKIARARQLRAKIGLHQGFDLVLNLVGELVAVRPEDLDAVVFKRVVRG